MSKRIYRFIKKQGYDKIFLILLSIYIIKYGIIKKNTGGEKMIEKETYEKPELKVIKFELKESIALSLNGVIHDEWFYGENE